jgi:hypothetical protein
VSVNRFYPQPVPGAAAGSKNSHRLRLAEDGVNWPRSAGAQGGLPDGAGLRRAERRRVGRHSRTEAWMKRRLAKRHGTGRSVQATGL